ncbi:unnamed protein product [Somion occarium]|uniref:DJ-1/PfpI domain-containing protein n=2 Tax=Somion occarium TaxID=3059160 RepID=A0ABP1DH67_9APHY
MFTALQYPNARLSVPIEHPSLPFCHTMTTTLKIAVCLFSDVANLDYGGPMELFSFLSPEGVNDGFIKSPIILQPTYLAESREPLRGSHVGPLITPDRAYGEVKGNEQFDIILIPGGARPDFVKPPVLEFLKRQVPGAKYVLAVCTGSWLLAQAGLLDGKRATTNKASFKIIQDATKGNNIQWVAKARWVVDGNLWTGSGVTAGIDMAHAFLKHLVGDETTNVIRGIVEVGVRDADDDEFAEFHNLI